MKKNLMKILFDGMMALILVLLYNTHALGIEFHEVGGLFIFFLFIVHCLLNKKWIASISRKFYFHPLPLRTKIGYVVDALLLISFILIMISGICFSRALFPSLASHERPWRTLHLFFSGISIVLVGIHLGLHWRFVLAVFKKMVWIPPHIAKPLNIVLLVLVLEFGMYSIVASNFTKLLSSPFAPEKKNMVYDDGSKNKTNSSTHIPKGWEENKMGHSMGSEAGKDDRNGSFGPKGPLMKKLPEGSPGAVASTIATFLAIMGVFTAITYYLDQLFTKQKQSLPKGAPK